MRKTLLVVMAAALLAGLGACGSSDTSGSAKGTSGTKGLTTVKVGTLPTATNAPIYVGIKHGFFKAEGLDVKPQVMNSSAVAVPSLLSNSVQFAYVGTPTTLIAKSKRIPISIVVNAGSSSNTPILVKEDSPIKTIADLKGKRIGVSSLGSLPEFTLIGALDQAGVARDEVKLLEVPLPDSAAAVERGTIDASWSTAPFSTIALKEGKVRSLGSAISGNLLGLGNAVFIAADKYLAGNKETAEAFARAVNRSNEYAAAHVDEMIATVPTFTQIKPGILGQEDVRSVFGKVDLDRMRNVETFMEKFGILQSKVDVNKLIWKSDEATG